MLIGVLAIQCRVRESMFMSSGKNMDIRQRTTLFWPIFSRIDVATVFLSSTSPHTCRTTCFAFFLLVPMLIGACRVIRCYYPFHFFTSLHFTPSLLHFFRASTRPGSRRSTTPTSNQKNPPGLGLDFCLVYFTRIPRRRAGPHMSCGMFFFEHANVAD